MSNFNLAVVEGNLTREPEVKFLQNGTAIGKFTIASNRVYFSGKEKKENTNFINIVTWGKLAENCGKYLDKGKRVLISGYLKFEKWTDKNGNSRNAIHVEAKEVNFLNSTSQAA